MFYRKRRIVVVLVVLASVAGTWLYREATAPAPTPPVLGSTSQLDAGEVAASPLTREVLETLEVKGRAPKTGYARDQFGVGWVAVGACDVRNRILLRDLRDVQTRSDTDCTVLSGTLDDPYTGNTIIFQRGEQTSSLVQIDHVVALSDAWQKGAQGLSAEERLQFANDGLNLLAVDGNINNQKSDSDAASWLPPNKAYRCQFVARQVAVKQKYRLWVTAAEKSAIGRVLASCPDQRSPIVS